MAGGNFVPRAICLKCHIIPKAVIPIPASLCLAFEERVLRYLLVCFGRYESGRIGKCRYKQFWNLTVEHDIIGTCYQSVVQLDAACLSRGVMIPGSEDVVSPVDDLLMRRWVIYSVEP